jgi:competence protein ComEC
MWVVVLDVGQGDAIALGFADGWWLVDAGGRAPRFDAGESTVLPFLRWAGVRRLETLALTHDDSDHVGGAPAVRRGLGVTRVLASPSFPGAPGPGPRFGAAAAARGDTLREAPLVRVLWPPRPPPAGARDTAAAPVSDNDAGLVLEVGSGAGRALLLADVDSTVERALVVAPGVALLKVAHHGSGSSSGATFLAALAARLAAISCGLHNAFGHPTAGALARLAAAGAEIHRTDREGALWFELSARGARRLDWRHGEPAASLAGRRPRAVPPPLAPRE